MKKPLTQAEALKRIREFDNEIENKLFQIEGLEFEAEEMVRRRRRFAKRHASLFSSRQLEAILADWKQAQP